MFFDFNIDAIRDTKTAPIATYPPPALSFLPNTNMKGDTSKGTKIMSQAISLIIRVHEMIIFKFISYVVKYLWWRNLALQKGLGSVWRLIFLPLFL